MILVPLTRRARWLPVLGVALSFIHSAVAMQATRPLDVLLKHSNKFKLGTKSLYEYEANRPTYVVQLPIDHYLLKSDTFSNRYWLNDTYYDGGPVFLYDNGEADASVYADDLLTESEGYIPTALMQLAKTYKGLAILWEHRYYGKSQPFGLAEDAVRTAQQWSFLTSEQALEDVVYFANNFVAPANTSLSSKLNHPSILQPKETPWIFIGGSYPGMRAAMLRVRNPDVIFASWASSAPVQAQVEMPSYFEAIQRGMTKNCSADFAAVTKAVDDALSDSNQTRVAEFKYSLVKAVLESSSGETNASAQLTVGEAAAWSNADVADILAEPLLGFQSLGYSYIEPFCDFVETRNGTVASVDGGIANKDGVEAAYNVFLDALAYLDYDGGYYRSDSNLTLWGPWGYQVCSEFGFYQISNPADPKNILTSFFSREYFDNICRATFSEGLPSSGPTVGNIIQYGGWNMNPSRVLFTNGELDPWRTLGLASVEDNSPKRPANATVPGCDAVHGDGSYFGVVYPGKVHVSDLSRDVYKSFGINNTDSFDQGLSLFKQALDQWLPCFKPNSTATSTSTSSSATSTSATSDATTLHLSFASVVCVLFLLVFHS